LWPIEAIICRFLLNVRFLAKPFLVHVVVEESFVEVASQTILTIVALNIMVVAVFGWDFRFFAEAFQSGRVQAGL
jgi:ABC-type bacteriocin/lantibiotic exporter with double-glycine peptidase domain